MPVDPPRSRDIGPDVKGRPADVHQSVVSAGRGLAIILAAVLALAAVAVLLGGRAVRQEQRAEAAERAVREQLHGSYLVQARAIRLTSRMGRRTDALAAISNAVAIRPSLELRNEAIASLALLDVEDRGVSLRWTELANLEFAADLTRYAFADAARKIHVMGLPDQKELLALDPDAVIPAEAGAVQNLTFSPDGRHLGARFNGGAVVIWSVAEQAVRVVAGRTATNRPLGTIRFSPETNLVTFANADRDGQLSTFDLGTGREVERVEIKVGARFFRFQPGASNVLGVASDQKIELRDSSSGRLLGTLSHAARVIYFRWAEDGRRLFAACQSGDVYDWDVPRQSYRILNGHGEACMAMLPTPDGEMLLTGSRDGTSRFWDLRTGRPVIELARGIALQLSPDGRSAIYWQPGVGYGLWTVHRAEGFATHATDPGQGGMSTFDLSLDGRWAVGTQSKGFRFWAVAGGFEKFVALPDFYSARFTTDSQALLVCRARGLEWWPFEVSPATGGQAATIRFGEVKKLDVPANNGVHAVSLARDGRTLVVEAGDYTTRAADLRGARAPVTLAGKPAGRWSRGPAVPTGAGRFAVSPDGQWVAQGMGFGNHPVVFSAVDGSRIAELAGETGNLMFSPTGGVLLAATTKSFDFYSTTNWQRLRRWERDEPSITYGAAAMSGDGALAAITPTRRTIRLVDVGTGHTVAEFQSPDRQAINSLRWSADGSTLTAAVADDSLHVWKLDRLRAQLAALKLDWAEDRSAAAETASAPPRPRSWSPPLALGLALVAVAALAAALVLRRHQTILRNYMDTEALSAQRRRDLETAKVELLHAQKMRALGTLAAGIAHDFNNLLSVIRMSNKLIARETGGHAEVRENVADIEQAVLQGKAVVGSMLGYARGHAAEDGPTDVSAVVEEAVSLLSKEFLSGIALTLELDPAAPRVGLSRGQLEQVLLNLIVNASEAMQGQGRLRIVVQGRSTPAARSYVLRPASAEPVVEMSVMDSGPGIGRDVRERLFEPFFTTKRAGAKPGTGLGLSLVYSIAQQSGLGLHVESEPGQGATFTLVIPTAPVREMHSSPIPTSP